MLDSESKNVVISHVYSSDNKGDAALTSVLIDDIKRAFPRAKITILRLESVKPNQKFEGVPEKPGFMYWAINRYQNPLIKLFYAVWMMGVTLFYALWLRFTGKHLYLPKHLRQTAKIYENADLIVPVGGGYIRSRAGLANRFNIPLILHPLLFGYLLGKPTVLYSQSVGPFQNGFENWLVAFVLQRMNLVLLREDTSVALLAKLGVTGNVKRAIDSGFLLTSRQKINIRKVYKIPADKLLIGVTVRAWLKGEAQKKYELAVAQTLDKIIKVRNAHVIFIPQVTANKGDDDRLTSQAVFNLMKEKSGATVIEDTPDHHEIKSMYDNLDVLLGTRFHSVIFSLTSYVPVAAIEYEHKTSGIMHDLKLDKWVIEIENVNADNLSKMLQKVIDEREIYRSHLQKYLPPYIERARQTANMMAMQLQRSQS